MKCFYIALCVVIASVALCEAQVQPITTPYTWDKYSVGYEVNTGLGFARDCSSGSYWKSDLCGGAGANFTYQANERFRMRAGISEEIYTSAREVQNPHPYVMDSTLKLKTISTRFIASSEFVFPNNQYRYTCFLGMGLYSDVIHYAKAKNSLHYISQNDLEILNLKDSFGTIMPGIMINAGFQGFVGRVDLRYTEDLRRFDVPGIPLGKQRRVGIALNYAYQWALPGGNP